MVQPLRAQRGARLRCRAPLHEPHDDRFMWSRRKANTPVQPLLPATGFWQRRRQKLISHSLQWKPGTCASACARETSGSSAAGAVSAMSSVTSVCRRQLTPHTITRSNKLDNGVLSSRPGPHLLGRQSQRFRLLAFELSGPAATLRLSHLPRHDCDRCKPAVWQRDLNQVGRWRNRQAAICTAALHHRVHEVWGCDLLVRGQRAPDNEHGRLRPPHPLVERGRWQSPRGRRATRGCGGSAPVDDGEVIYVEVC